MTPWDFWMRSWSSGVAASQVGLRFAEMMQASNTVITSRCETMAAAARDPVNGDYRELSRMVPEKVAAFGESARTTMGDMAAIQSDAAAHWQQLSAMAWRGRPPTFAELDTLSERALRMAERAIGAGGAALKPVHKTATGNAKRLRGGKR